MGHFDKGEVAARFLRYAGVFTQSEEGVADTPSTKCQRDLAVMLRDELEAMGAADVYYDEAKCYVYATIPGTIPADAARVSALPDAAKKHRENTAPILGLVAHMDTSNAVDAKEHPFVHPRLIEKYDGGEIVLNAEQGISMSTAEYPLLKNQIGKSIVVTDGTTVLGGDDKAGVTQIMEAADFFLRHKEYAHGTIRILFTPDEEVGNGTRNVDMDHFGVDYAYTVDGSAVGELEYENFNAASAHVTVRGLSTHPGDAYGKMRNALLVAMEFNRLLPPEEIPACTRGYEGFYHLDELSGTTERAFLDYILRDHDRAKFEERKRKVQDIAAQLNEKYGEGVVTVDVKDSYYNMAEKILPQKHLIENAEAAIREAGLVPVTNPIRGGTDGAVLSFRGIPCPNLGTGAYNYHSRYEYVSVDEMCLGAEILLRILNKYASFEVDG